MSESTTTTRRVVIHVTEAAGDVGARVEAALAAEGLTVVPAEDVYAAMAELVAGAARRPAAVLVDLDRIESAEMEFFELARQVDRSLPCFVYASRENAAKIRAAGEQGALAVACTDLPDMVEAVRTGAMREPQPRFAGPTQPLLHVALARTEPAAASTTAPVAPVPTVPTEERVAAGVPCESEAGAEPVSSEADAEAEPTDVPQTGSPPVPWAPSELRPSRTPPQQTPPPEPPQPVVPAVPQASSDPPQTQEPRVELTAEELEALLGPARPAAHPSTGNGS